MIKHRKKLLTKVLATMIAGLFGLESVAVAATVPLRATSSLSNGIKAPESLNIQLKGGVKIDSREQLITLNLVNSDLRQVLRMLADKAGKNIIIDDSVGTAPTSSSGEGGNGSTASQGNAGTISLDLVNVTVNKAFEYIMTLKQLTYWQDGNTLIIASSSRASELGLNKTEIRPIKIKYVDAQKIADFLNSNIFSLNKPDISRSAIVTSNPSTNEVYIFGKNNDYELARKVISRLDIKPQVNTFNVNYADPSILASKICMTVFQNSGSSSGASSGGSTSSSSSSDSSSGSSGGTPSLSSSQINAICSGTSGGMSSGSSSSSGETSSSEGSSSTTSSGLSAFSSPSYMVLADPGLNQITLFGGTQEQVNLAEEIIKNFDKKEPQVYLEISIIELSEDGSKSLSNMIQGFGNEGVIYGTSGGQSGIGYVKSMAGLGNALLSVPGFTVPATFNIPTTPSGTSTSPVYIPVAGNYYGAINSVITNGKGRILANPRIIASNNSESTINIQEQVVSSVTTSTTIGSSTNNTTTVEHGDVGIELSITPKISPNGYVTLNLNPSYDSVKGSDGFGGTLTRSREFKSANVRVKNGETLVIAGLIQETENNTQKKTPLLADLPIVGTLFKDQSTSKSRSELIFMITPRIIKEDEPESI